MISIRIKAYELELELQSSETYPDALSDLVNRATTSFAMCVATMKSANIDLFNVFTPSDLEDD
jgi:hypothetical protein